MAQQSTIEWTDTTWNPVIGCRKVSAGCKNCYAERMAKRLAAMASADLESGRNSGKKAAYLNVLSPRGHWNGSIFLDESAVDEPLSWRSPRVIFVNSMSDLFHEDVPLEFIARIFDVAHRTPQHTYQVLTKRPHRVVEMDAKLNWPNNVWMGTSVEDSRVLNRVHQLQRTSARIKFLSVEPLLGPIPHLPLDGIDWVIVGGESGPGARPMDGAWVRPIRDRCLRYHVPFFFKQWGGTNKALTGRILDKRTWDEMPPLAHNNLIGESDAGRVTRRCRSTHPRQAQNTSGIPEGMATDSRSGTKKSFALL
jgi:protein gp37